MTDKQRNDAIDLIAEIVKKADGVGSSKAFALAEYLDGNWKRFIKADETVISGLKKENGKPVFSEDHIETILGFAREFFEIEDVRTAWIYLIGKDFLFAQILTLNRIALSNLDINPLLMKVLDFKTPTEVLEFNLYQTVTRSIVTSWGSTVENLLVRCGAERIDVKNSGRAGRRPDIKKRIGEKNFYIQVKSGPNTMNVDMVNSLNEVITEYKKNEPNSTFLLGMTYGKKERISSQIRDNLHDFENSFLIGRHLWDFVSEEQNFHRQLFKVLDQASQMITSKNFSEHLAEQLTTLVDEWHERYDEQTLDEVFENYL